jgi:hypothetical protein
MKTRNWDDMKALMEKYKFITPKTTESTAVMGGVWVLGDGGEVRGRPATFTANLLSSVEKRLPAYLNLPTWTRLPEHAYLTPGTACLPEHSTWGRDSV